MHAIGGAIRKFYKQIFLEIYLGHSSENRSLLVRYFSLLFT